MDTCRGPESPRPPTGTWPQLTQSGLQRPVVSGRHVVESEQPPASLHPRLRGLVKDKQLTLDLQHKADAQEPPGLTSYRLGDTSGSWPLFCPAFKLKWILHFQKSI